VLLVVAGLLAHSLFASNAANVGFETRGLAVVALDTDMVRYTPERSRQFWTDALARVRNLPGVTQVGLASPRVPFDINYQTQEYHVEGRTYASGQRGETLDMVAVTPGYFDTLGVTILRGRDFLDSDREGAPLVAIISDAMARSLWPNESPIGKAITTVASSRRYEIVGVSADYKVRSVMESPRPYVHLAVNQRPATYNAILARASRDADDVVRSIRRMLLEMEPGLVFVNQGTMERTFAGTLLPIRIGAWLAASFSLLGTLLAGVGLYGIVAFAVSQRTREIGIRLALGASRADVRRMILQQGMRLVIAGAIAGSLLAALAATGLSSILYGVGAADPVAWTIAIAVLLAAAALAHLVPTRRALRVDPASSLRE
jgi:predicted permease